MFINPVRVSRRAALQSLSLGSGAICVAAASSSMAELVWQPTRRAGIEVWVFARPHHDLYSPNIKRWSDERLFGLELNLDQLSLPALERRIVAGFLSDMPVADLIEADVNIGSRAFTGPLSDVGFVDLTNLLRDEGIYGELNEPSFSPWTSRGHIFGLPHDVHPVMLAYRADILASAGIDASAIATWDDFARALRPLMKDSDGDGMPDHYPLNLWETQMDTIEALLLQAGGEYFDQTENPAVNSDVNAEAISTIVTWLAGPTRIAIDAEEFKASSNTLKLRGTVIASIMPDWLAGVWKQEMPALAGKLSLMPLPAWRPGGRRTSVWGGTMLGIARSTKHFKASWELAKRLYFSETLAQQLYATNGIISPVKRFWKCDFYDQPDPYFANQRPGRMYVQLAPDVPRRTSSPFNRLAKQRVRDAVVGLKQYAVLNSVYSVSGLFQEAQRQLKLAQEALELEVERNVFLKEHS